jgi:hypothetical protein
MMNLLLIYALIALLLIYSSESWIDRANIFNIIVTIFVDFTITFMVGTNLLYSLLHYDETGEYGEEPTDE